MGYFEPIKNWAEGLVNIYVKLSAPWLNNAALNKVSGVAVGEVAQTAGIVVRRKKTKG